MLGQRAPHCLGVHLPQLRTALDVSEQESDVAPGCLHARERKRVPCYRRTATLQLRMPVLATLALLTLNARDETHFLERQWYSRGAEEGLSRLSDNRETGRHLPSG